SAGGRSRNVSTGPSSPRCRCAPPLPGRRRRAATRAPARRARSSGERGPRSPRPAPSPTGASSMTPPTVASPRPAGDGALKQRVHRRLVTAGGVDPLDDLDRLDIQKGPRRLLAVRTGLAELPAAEAPLLSPAGFERLLRELTDEVSGLGPLEPLLADPEVSEVMVNGPGRAYIERAGRLEEVALDLDAGAIVRLVERVVAPLGLRLDRASPMVDARLADGSRLHALIPPLALDRPCVTIPRFPP